MALVSWVVSRHRKGSAPVLLGRSGLRRRTAQHMNLLWKIPLRMACATVATLAGVATAAHPLTIARALDLAFTKNSEVLAARQELIVAQGRIEKAGYWNPFNPEIEVAAAERRFGRGAVELSSAVSLEVEVAGQRAKRIEEAERNLGRVRAEVEDLERRVRAAVQDAFYRALYLQRRLGLLKEVEDLNRRLRDASLERFKSGEVAKLEANLAAVRYSQARKEFLSADRDQRNAVAELERLLGCEPDGSTELAGDLSMEPVDFEEQRLLDIALGTRPDLRAREAEIARVDAEASLTRRLIFPNPRLRGTYEEDAGEGRTRDQIFGGEISLPLPVFDRKRPELTALSGLRAKAVHERDGARLAVETEVREALRTYRAAREGAELFEAEAVESIRESFGFVETAYRQGKIGLLELVVVANDLVAAELSYIGSLQDFWAARIALERAVGRQLEKGVNQ